MLFIAPLEIEVRDFDLCMVDGVNKQQCAQGLQCSTTIIKSATRSKRGK